MLRSAEVARYRPCAPIYAALIAAFGPCREYRLLSFVTLRLWT